MITTKRKYPAIAPLDPLHEVTRFSTILWCLGEQGYKENRARLKARLEYEANRQYLRQRYLLSEQRSGFKPALKSPQLPKISA